MREFKLKTVPFQFLDILDFGISKEPNEHGRAFITGTIPEEEEERYVSSSDDGTLELYAVDENGKERILFSGKIENASLDTMGNVRKFTVTAVTFSADEDKKRKIRTFQDAGTDFAAVTNTLAGDAGATYMAVRGSGQPIGSMKVQYEETNWEFAKRLASYLNTVLVADYSLKSAYISIGMPQRSRGATVDTSKYIMGKDLKWLRDIQQNGGPNLGESAAIYYDIEEREIFDLCESVIFRGATMYVHSIKTMLKGSELVHRYRLKPEAGFVTRPFFNDSIIGASLNGSVSSVRADKVQVSISGDTAQSNLQWFDYATVYSSPDGPGWYFMPSEGDLVRLHFPTEHEADAFAISSAHLQHSDRTNPEIKYITTPARKSIQFAPGRITMSNGAGSSVELEDAGGVFIKSTKDVQITAEQGITIRGQGAVAVQGEQGVTVQQNDSMIKIDDNIDLAAGHVRIS